jgi:hypothetical protein
METTAAIAQWIRLSGEPDELKSFHWIEARLREYGYRTDLTHHRAYISLPESASLHIQGEKEITGISHAFATSTPPGGLTARLVDSRDPNADVAGAIVLVDGMASGETVHAWEKRGCIAQVHVHDDHLHETSISPIWGNPTDKTIDLMPRTPSLAIRQQDAHLLRNRLASGPLTVTIETEVLTEWRLIPLLTAELPGGAAKPYVLLSTHVDSWYYGAMDNGSANATTLEVAKLLAENPDASERSLRLAFWSGHSHGRFAGSAWYADQHWQDLHDHCVAHVFVDSTGGKNATVITEAPVMPQTHGLATAVVKTVTDESFEGKRIGRFADQSFYGIGINSIFGTLSEQDAANSENTISFKTGGRRAGGLGWWWHTPDDTIDKVDEVLLVRDTCIYLAAVHRLLTSPRLPFDYRPAINEILETVIPRAAAARAQLDLTALIADLEQTKSAIELLHETIPASPTDANPVVNQTLMMLARHLVPIAFHQDGRFGRDPAAPLMPVPALYDLEELASLPSDSALAHAMATRLHRTSNWIRAEAQAATRLAQQAVGVLLDARAGSLDPTSAR